jgi:hypothetical protein
MTIETSYLRKVRTQSFSSRESRCVYASLGVAMRLLGLVAAYPEARIRRIKNV